MAVSEDALWNMSDEEIEAAFREARASGETGYESGNNNEEFNSNDYEEVDHVEEPVDQESDDDASLDDAEIDTDAEDSETDDVDADEPTEDDDENTDADENINDNSKQPVYNNDNEVLTFKANGQDYHFTVAEMKAQFGKVFAQAMDYTKKTQAIKPYRKTIDAIEQSGITHEDVNLMIDVLKGDKDAIAAVLKRTGIDALDIDTEQSKYVAKDYGRNETELAIREVIEDISRDKEYNTTYNVLQKQWDDRSKEEFVSDPNLIRLLHVDVKSGMFDTINPIAQKLKLYDNSRQSDLEYYKMAAEQYFDAQAQLQSQADYNNRQRAEAQYQQEETRRKAEEAKAKQIKQANIQKAAPKRKAAAPSKAGGSTAKKAIDYLDDSEEAFEEWYNERVISQM